MPALPAMPAMPASPASPAGPSVPEVPASPAFTLIPQQGSGRGRLARTANTVIYSVGDPAATAALIGWCRLAADRPAADVVAELTRLADGASTLGAFCAIVVGDDGLDVITAGGVPLRAQSPAGERVVGDGRSRWDDVSALNLLVGDGPLDAQLTLVEGVVAADGFSLRRTVETPLPWGSAPEPASAAPHSLPAAAPAAAPATPAWPAPVAPVRAAGAPADVPSPPPPPPSAPAPVPGVVSLDVADDDLPPMEPLPTPGAPQEPPPPAPASGPAPPPRQPPPAPAQPPPAPVPDTPPHQPGATSRTDQPPPAPVKVKGLVCSRGHFNDPRTRFCAVCGIAMHQTSLILTEADRPPLGVLTMSDGNVYTLVTSLVFGRDPGEDDEVRAGRAQGIQLVDPGNTISRVHAEIRGVEWDVHLIDQGSTNGTFLWSAERQQWDRLTPHQPVVLAPGAHVSFGRLTATFQSGSRQKG